jgi:uncharacterized protein (TIGR02453 family)
MAHQPVTFDGFPERGLIFYEGLEADNSKPYWTDHREVYERDVKAPMLALLAELEGEFGPGRMFRPYRDVRFSKDKTPYKVNAAGMAGSFYVSLGADGLWAGGGYWRPAPDQLERLRRAVADDVQGPALERVLDGVRAAGLDVGGDRMTRAPRGYPADHPRVELLKHRGLTASRHWEPAEWLHTPEALTRVRDGWRAVRPLAGWLESNVGPSDRPAERR